MWLYDFKWKLFTVEQYHTDKKKKKNSTPVNYTVGCWGFRLLLGHRLRLARECFPYGFEWKPYRGNLNSSSASSCCGVKLSPRPRRADTTGGAGLFGFEILSTFKCPIKVHTHTLMCDLRGRRGVWGGWAERETVMEMRRATKKEEEESEKTAELAKTLFGVCHISCGSWLIVPKTPSGLKWEVVQWSSSKAVTLRWDRIL